MGQIHNPGSRSVAKVRVQKAGWGGARVKEAGSGRSQVWEATWGRVRLRKTAGGGARAGGGNCDQSKAVLGQGGRYLDFGGSVGETKGRRLSRES